MGGNVCQQEKGKEESKVGNNNIFILNKIQLQNGSTHLTWDEF